MYQLESKKQLSRAIERIEIHQYCTGAIGCELDQHPLRRVGCPDSNPVAALHTQSQQTSSQCLYLCDTEWP